MEGRYYYSSYTIKNFNKSTLFNSTWNKKVSQQSLDNGKNITFLNETKVSRKFSNWKRKNWDSLKISKLWKKKKFLSSSITSSSFQLFVIRVILQIPYFTLCTSNSGEFLRNNDARCFLEEFKSRPKFEIRRSYAEIINYRIWRNAQPFASPIFEAPSWWWYWNVSYELTGLENNARFVFL